MKKILLITLVMCVNTARGQFSIVNFPNTDLGLSAQSGKASYRYLSLIPTQHCLTRMVNAYGSAYSKRMIYYSGVLIMNQINGELDQSKNRLQRLVLGNDKLDEIKYYSKRKENEKLLAAVEEKLYILEQELDKQDKLVIYGEKLNLLQNTMLTLTRVNRKLDLIEKNIKESEYIKKIIIMLME